jgi:hypothetical protein
LFYDDYDHVPEPVVSYVDSSATMTTSSMYLWFMLYSQLK